MKKQSSNEEFVKKLLKTSGAWGHAFILEAIANYSHTVATTPMEQLAARFGPNPLVTPELWQSAAKVIDQQCTARLGLRATPAPLAPAVRVIVVVEDGCVTGVCGSPGIAFEVSVLDKDTDAYKRAMEGDTDGEDATTARALDNEANQLDPIY